MYMWHSPVKWPAYCRPILPLPATIQMLHHARWAHQMQRTLHCSGVHCIVSTVSIDLGSQVFPPFLDSNFLPKLLPTILRPLVPPARVGMRKEGAKPSSRGKGVKRPTGKYIPSLPAPLHSGVWGVAKACHR